MQELTQDLEQIVQEFDLSNFEFPKVEEADTQEPILAKEDEIISTKAKFDELSSLKSVELHQKQKQVHQIR